MRRKRDLPASETRIRCKLEACTTLTNSELPLMLCLGIGSGTQSTKALVLDIDKGKVLALAQSAYGTIEGLPAGHVDQDPATWINAAETTVGECLEKIGDRR